MITYADDSVIYTSSKDVVTIQRNLNEDINCLCRWFKENGLIVNFKKGKTEAILFGTAKRINFQGNELNISVNGACINNMSVYKYVVVDVDPNLNLISYFDRIYKKVAGRANLLTSIRSSIDQKCAETIYKTMILPVFTYSGSLGLGWSELTRYQMHTKCNIYSGPTAYVSCPLHSLPFQHRASLKMNCVSSC